MIKAAIITIGDELLIGQVIDTNSAFIAQQLNLAGFSVAKRVAVGDVYNDIKNALDQTKQEADIILITGGLGPTADDITKPLLCDYFGGKMVVNQEALTFIEHLFANVFKRPFTERNKKQAEVPDVCTVIQNKKGTAPGMAFFEEVNGRKKIFISMPGVPFEMMAMMTDDVIPLLKETFNPSKIEHRTLLTAGIGESMLADMIEDFETALPTHIKLAYLPNYGMVRLRLSATYNETPNDTTEVDTLFNTLQNLVHVYLVTNVDETMEQTVAKLLIANNKTVSTAESCTGGYIAHLLTTKAGASAYFEGSVVSYSYHAKEALLQVNNDTLLTHGAVSEAVVIEMAKGTLKNLGTHYTIAVSGIMGPGGGMPDKPVGTVWVCVGSQQKLIQRKFEFRFDRDRNIKLTALYALNMLRQFILTDDSN
ncbi:competence/damage-inducible protein A [Ferruginibacter yonginensis]|uniref:CinA-like protein n=1 Tax=Ferruginibacter yonginensis TaxID=1310416 RepID=A0ABV8QX80_9BACT